MGLNTTVNKTTGKSPSEVLFGSRLRTKSDGIVSSLLDKIGNKTQTVEEVIKEVKLRLTNDKEKQENRFKT